MPFGVSRGRGEMQIQELDLAHSDLRDSMEGLSVLPPPLPGLRGPSGKMKLETGWQ